MPEAESPSDAQLVQLTRNGDRDAFGQIVARYQGLICALSYSACGDISKSEDFAQETFFAAWKKIADLRDPANLKHWLFGIARNLINNSFRQQSRNPLEKAQVLEGLDATDVTRQNSPSSEAISKEEAAILWRVLEKMPEAYREPMVMFYRQEQSTSEVAALLGVSEDAVRQRLSRGRAMLDERVSRLVEAGLKRSGPTQAFTLGVIAALPIASANATAAGAIAASAKSSTAAKGAGVLNVFGTAFAVIVPVLAATIAFIGRIQNAKSGRERKFLSWAYLALVPMIGVIVGAGYALIHNGVLDFSSSLSNTVGWILVWMTLSTVFSFYGIWMLHRQRRIQAEDGTLVGVPRLSWNAAPSPKGFKANTGGSLAALILGAGSWLTVAAASAHDILMLWTIPLAVLAACWVATRWVWKHPEHIHPFFIAVWIATTLFALAIVNLRWDVWQREVALYAFPNGPAPVGINLLILFVYGSIGIGWWLQRHFLSSVKVRRDAFITAAVFIALFLAGLAVRNMAIATEMIPQALQVSINEIQTNGMIRVKVLTEEPNRTGSNQNQVQFVASDALRIHRMTDGTGRVLAFTTQPQPGLLRYSATLKNPVAPRQKVTIKFEGDMSGELRKLQNGEYELFYNHSPANGLITRVTTVYTLPPGARLTHKEPSSVTTSTRSNGGIELSLEKVIRPNDSISLKFRYNLD